MEEIIRKLISKYWAKKNGETIQEHTEKTLRSFEILTDYLNFNDAEKEIVRELIFFHDLGKIYASFQKKIGNEEFKDFDGIDIPHEMLSPIFIWPKKIEEIKEKFSKMGLDKEIFFRFFVFLIISHHHRNNEKYNRKDLNETIVKAIDKIKEQIAKDFGISNIKLEYYYRVSELIKYFNDFGKSEIKRLLPHRVRWLGSLIKSDYTSSAGIEPEVRYEGNYMEDFKNFLNHKGFKLKEFQINVGENFDKSVILVASTGMGKTEASMNWIRGSKGIYLLGIRTAVNEIYRRYKSVFGENNVGLLHGESIYFLLQEGNDNNYETKLEKIRKLSYPLTIATGDQIITSVFKYPGFELTYLTCSYSKIVIDEIQSYDPSSIASIIVFLKEIHKLGGKFLLMTATLPKFVRKELEELDNVIFLGPYFININRHKIKIIDEYITPEEIIKILKANKDKRVLIILNTVSKSQQIYEKLKENKFDVNLIHSRFTNRDRREKEKLITSANSSIWISTQVVEVSLDVDFDILITECASIESLIQRMGRCYRKREYTSEKPNIYIFRYDNTSKIYDKRLVERTWAVIRNYDEKMITEAEKYEIMDEIFSQIEDTNYYNDYVSKKDLLELGYTTKSKDEALREFREIAINYTVIPIQVFQDNRNTIESLLEFIDNTKNDKYERLKKQAELMDLVVPIQGYLGKKASIEDLGYYGIKSDFCKRHYIYLLKNCEYSFEKGLTFTEKTISDNIID